MLFACSRCLAPHPMMVVLGISWLHHTRASLTLGWWPHWPHWTSGMCGSAMHLLCIEEVFALPLTPIGPVFLVSFRLVPQGSTTTTLALLLFPWANKAAAPPHKSQGPHATCGAVRCEVLLDVSDDTTVFCVTCGNVSLCATQGAEGQCGACQEGAWNQGETMTQHIGVAWGRCPAPLQFCMPVDGATFFCNS